MQLAAEIAHRLATLPNPSTPAIRHMRREYSVRLRQAPAADVLELAEELLREPLTHARRFVAYERVAAHPAARSVLDSEIIMERFGRGMADWGAVDMFGTLISGPARRAGQIGDRTIEGWAASTDRWWRRAALVSTTGLNVRGTPGDAERTLKIARRLAADRDDMVVKAMSWALRAFAQRDPESVRQFMHQQQLAPQVKREVSNTLETGLKNPRPTAGRTRSPQGPA